MKAVIASKSRPDVAVNVEGTVDEITRLVDRVFGAPSDNRPLALPAPSEPEEIARPPIRDGETVPVEPEPQAAPAEPEPEPIRPPRVKAPKSPKDLEVPEFEKRKQGQPWDPKDERLRSKWAKRLHKAGHSNNAIASKLRTSKKSVAGWLRDGHAPAPRARTRPVAEPPAPEPDPEPEEATAEAARPLESSEHLSPQTLVEAMNDLTRGVPPTSFHRSHHLKSPLLELTGALTILLEGCGERAPAKPGRASSFALQAWQILPSREKQTRADAAVSGSAQTET